MQDTKCFLWQSKFECVYYKTSGAIVATEDANFSVYSWFNNCLNDVQDFRLWRLDLFT